MVLIALRAWRLSEAMTYEVLCINNGIMPEA